MNARPIESGPSWALPLWAPAASATASCLRILV
jgi:hypothetical protein